MKKIKLTGFITYLLDQIGQPYVWGGQHTKLTPDNYVSVITKKETDPGNRNAAILYCRKKFDAGAAELYAYDCSGLGMYYLQNVTGVFGRDMNANGMMGQCEAADLPKCGCWVFRLGSDGKATHIGYLISDTEVVHAKGRAYGVVREPYKPSYWHRIGKPKCIEFADSGDTSSGGLRLPTPAAGKQRIINSAASSPTGCAAKFVPSEGKALSVRVKGSVRVREGNGTAYKAIGTAHKGDLLPCVMQADAYPHWYRVDFHGRDGWITSNARYTEVVG